MHYLDHAATAPTGEAARRAVTEVLEHSFGNPSSLYRLGVEAEQRLSAARTTVADALGCKSREVYFTACGTESNNLAILGAARARANWANEIVTTAYEHPSVQNTVRALKNEGFTVHEIRPKNGSIDPEELLCRVGPKTALVAAMRVNNETGAMLDVSSLGLAVKEINKRTAVHCDCVQGFLKHPAPLAGIDTLALSGHKIGAPKGIGALYLRSGFHVRQTQFGGGQEQGLRSGTENVAFAAGLAAACIEHADLAANLRHVSALKARLIEGLGEIPGAVIHSREDFSPYIVCFSLPGYRSETMIHFLEQKDIFVSGGSACSKGERSHTLTAMGLAQPLVMSALRVSFSKESSEADVDALIAGLKEIPDRLMRS